eukprot:130831_1
MAIGSSVAVILLTFVFCAMNYVSTFMLIAKYKRSKTTQIEASDPDVDTAQASRIDLDKILSNKQATHLFMLHLSKEYSIECLLSYIEFTQYRQYLVSEMDKLGMNPDYSSNLSDVPQSPQTSTPSEPHHQSFPSNIPQSLIVSDSTKHTHADSTQDEELLCSAKIKAHKLYAKYIQNGSEFEINISHGRRENLDVLE